MMEKKRDLFIPPPNLPPLIKGGGDFPPLLSVVILNWNTKDLLRDCLKSVFESWQNNVGATPVINTGQAFVVPRGQAHGQPQGSSLQNNALEIIVADNASSDGSVAMVKKEFPQVKLIVNKKNLGFAKGNNLGIQEARGKYTLLLNSDAIVKKGALQKMVAVAEKDKKIGALGPRLLNQDGSDQWQFHRKFPTLAQILWVYTTILSRLTPQISFLRQRYLGKQDRKKSGTTELQLSGAALMVRTALLKKLNGFDEKFFFWLEDVDLCWRIKELGYKLYYVAEAEIIHLGGASSALWSDFQRLYNFRLSMLKYFQKYEPREARLVRLIFKLDALSMIPLTLLIKPSRVKVYWQFLREF